MSRRATAEQLLPVTEVAELWRCSRDHVYDLIAAGELRIVNLGTGRAKTRVPESAMAEYVERHSRVAPQGAASKPPPAKTPPPTNPPRKAPPPAAPVTLPPPAGPKKNAGVAA